MSNPHNLLLRTATERTLTRSEADQVFSAMMSGELSPVMIAGFLMALRMRGESVDDITAATAAMRARLRPVSAPDGAIDIVGTGGDGRGTLNISTLTAIVVAGAGVPVAKHGNKALSSKSGASDALSLLGVNLSASIPEIESALKTGGLAYMAAPNHHPAMKYVMPVRLEMGIRTIFNILGPLTNPAGVKRQLTGAYRPELLRPMAETLGALGSEVVWLVYGHDGTDELSIAGPSSVVAWEKGALREFTLTPGDAGLPIHPFEHIVGGEPAENVRKIRAILANDPDENLTAYRDAVLLNSAAALKIADKVTSLPEGVAKARESLSSGAAQRAIETLVQLSNSH